MCVGVSSCEGVCLEIVGQNVGGLWNGLGAAAAAARLSVS